MTLLSAVLFTAWSTVNRSTQLSLAARRRITVVNQIKEQAEVLKAMYANENTREQVNSKQFGGPTKINPLTSAPAANACEDTRESGVANAKTPSSPFSFDDNAVGRPGVKQLVQGDSSAITWIQFQSKSGGYTDFYVRACWLSVGGSDKEENSTVIVRLNDV